MTIQELLIQKLMSANAHMGKRGAAHHFKVFTYGSRNGMTVIDSDKTLICLRNACDFMSNLVRLKGRFLFVNTNPLYDEIVDQMTQKIGLGSSSKFQYWRLCGFLTNSSSPKKFKSRNKKIIFGPTQPPDCLVIMDTANKSSVIKEASRLEIPIVGLVDPNMPWDTYQKITYPIPCNDSAKFVYLFCNLITKTFLLEQKRMGVISAAEDNLDLLVSPSFAEPDLLKGVQDGDSVERGVEEEKKSAAEERLIMQQISWRLQFLQMLLCECFFRTAIKLLYLGFRSGLWDMFKILLLSCPFLFYYVSKTSSSLMVRDCLSCKGVLGFTLYQKKKKVCCRGMKSLVMLKSLA